MQWLAETVVPDSAKAFWEAEYRRTGKSHLATALGMAACAQGRKVRFFRVTELIALLLEAKDERQLLRLRQQLAKLDL